MEALRQECAGTLKEQQEDKHGWKRGSKGGWRETCQYNVYGKWGGTTDHLGTVSHGDPLLPPASSFLTTVTFIAKAFTDHLPSFINKIVKF